MEAGPSYTVLRIKRKATEPPLSSLVIQNDPSHPSTGFGTPKKRRDVSYKPRGVFKLADTVPDSWIGKGQEGEVLKERIRGLMVDPAPTPEAKDKGKGKEVDTDSADNEEMFNAPKRAVTPPHAPQSTQSGMQYRVINPLSNSTPKRPRGAHGLPPPVLSYAEVEAQARSPFRFIDAQAIDRSSRSTGVRESKQVKEEEKDPQMAAFEDMLEEYLTLERSEASRKEAEEEYVYDLYYRDVRDASLALSARADGMSATSIGALIGFDDLSPPSSPSSSEPEDEADEDSNDEDFYRNDYPEDEDADSDMEGFDDAFGSESEEESENGSARSDEERGKWDYR